MRDVTSDLARVWGRNTALIGAALLIAGLFWSGFDGPRWTAAWLVAAWLGLWNTWACARAWAARAQYRWFWWTR